jgi:hypothetical protein
MQKSRRFVPIQMTRRRSTEDEYVLFSFNRIIYTNTSCFDEMNFSERERRDLLLLHFPKREGVRLVYDLIRHAKRRRHFRS